MRKRKRSHDHHFYRRGKYSKYYSKTKDEEEDEEDWSGSEIKSALLSEIEEEKEKVFTLSLLHGLKSIYYYNTS